jgi:hypothetical protein
MTVRGYGCLKSIAEHCLYLLKTTGVWCTNTAMRRAARVDATQAEIVSALRSIGASVWIIGLPVDLLVGYGGATLLIEVKVPVGKRNPRPSSYTPLQVAFMTCWTGGPVATVTDVEGAVRAVRCAAKTAAA